MPDLSHMPDLTSIMTVIFGRDNKKINCHHIV